MKNVLLFSLFSIALFLDGCGGNSGKQNPRTILIVVDGLASGAIEKIRLVHLQNWKKEGCYYNTVYVPLPAHPDKTSGYTWSCSIPYPVMMTGTVFIGQNDIKNNMVQHMFAGKKSAFIVNDDSYGDISKDFDFYYMLKSKEEDRFKDELVFNKAREVLDDENPSFLVLHLQGPGSAGNESAFPENSKEKWYHNIWNENSPYVDQLKRDDQLIEEFINWLEYEGYWESTTLIIIGDQGQATEGGNPAYNPESCKTEMLILGRSVKPGAEFNYAEITDIAPTIIRINGLSSLRYSKGRVLEEAFKWGPASFDPERNLQHLDELLISRHSSGASAGAGNSGFLTIDRICDWHKMISVITVDEFIQYEEKN